MNAPHAPSPLAAVDMAPKDPILGVTEAYVADQNPKKVNLGVGVYTDDNGKVPLLECVRRAEDSRVRSGAPKSYLPIDGIAAYDKAVRELVFGSSCSALNENRVVTIQALGGTGGLKIGADFLKQISPAATVWISGSCNCSNLLPVISGGTARSMRYSMVGARSIPWSNRSSTVPGLKCAGAGIPPSGEGHRMTRGTSKPSS